MTKHTNIYLDSASRRQRGLLSIRTPSGQAAIKFGLAVDQRGVPTLWRSKGYRPGITKRWKLGSLTLSKRLNIKSWSTAKITPKRVLKLGTTLPKMT